MFRLTVLLVILPYLLELDAVSIASKRLSLIYHEPPVESNLRGADRVSEHYITQRLDNFDHQNHRTFQMRYLKNDEYFESGGPIFIFIGGEWTIAPGHITQGQLINDMAKESNGLLIYTEHRFYGKTIPTDSITVDDLKYLSVEQSLADLAHFVREITSDEKLNATGGVIVVGGSYSATMAVWFRQKYPHLVNGAWASSAPLQAKLDYFEYTETVGRSIRTVGGEKCYKNIELTFKAIDRMLANKDKDTLTNLFKVCDDFDLENNFDIWNFASSVKDIFSGLVQGGGSQNIKYYCNILDESVDETNDIEVLKRFYNIFKLNYYPAGNCNSFKYDDMVKEIKAEPTFLPWYYQTCSEFGWYQTTDSLEQPFGEKAPVELYLRLCQDVYSVVFNNSTFERSISHTNDLYGGFDPSVTNVYFSHGSLDPWHRMGVLSDLNEHSPGVVIDGISHCRDLGSINYNTDSMQLLQSKVNLMILVKKWLKY